MLIKCVYIEISGDCVIQWKEECGVLYHELTRESPPPISVLIFFLKVKLHLRDCYCIWVYNETDTCQLESTKVEGTKKQTR